MTSLTIPSLYKLDQSYDANLLGPTDPLPPVSAEVVDADANRQLFGMPIGYPIGVPASPLTANSTWIALCASQGFNVLTYKTVRNEPSAALPPPNWLFVDGLTSPLTPGNEIESVRVDLSRISAGGSHAYSMVNSCGMPSTAPAEWQADVRRSLDELRPGQLLIVSVVGDYETLNGQELVDDFVAVAARAEEAGARVIELNLSCPNSVSRRGDGLRPPICESPKDTHRIVSAVSAALRPETKLVAKLGYLARSDLEDVVAPILGSVAGLSGINTLQVGVEDTRHGPVFKGTLSDHNEPRKQAGLSGIAIRDLALDFVRTLALLRRRRGCSFEIIGMGGVMEPHDVRALMACGADAVQAATAAQNHWNLPRRLCNDGHPVPSTEERLLGLIGSAMADERWPFRTADGLAAELRVSADLIRRLLEVHPDLARRSVMNDRRGRELYTAAQRTRGVRERLEEFRWLLAR